MTDSANSRSTGDHHLAEVSGFVGLGAMGAGIARNLMSAGTDLIVFDLRADVVASFAESGAKVAARHSDLAPCDLVFLSLPGPPEFEEVLFGADGLASVLSPGSLVIDLTTNRCDTVRSAAQRLADRGIDLLDAPVSGGHAGAEQGTLSIAVGGSERAFARARPYLEQFSARLVHAGDAGAGDACKLIHNLGLNIQRQALAEMFTLAAKAGVDPQVMYEFVKVGSFGRNDLLHWMPARVFTRDFEHADPPWFRHALSIKDARLGIALAEELNVPTPLGSVCLGLVQQVTDGGWDARDSWMVFTLQEEAADVVVRAAEAGVSPPGEASD